MSNSYTDVVEVVIRADPGRHVMTCFLDVVIAGNIIAKINITDDATQAAAIEAAGLAVKAVVCSAIEDAINESRGRAPKISQGK